MNQHKFRHQKGSATSVVMIDTLGQCRLAACYDSMSIEVIRKYGSNAISCQHCPTLRMNQTAVCRVPRLDYRPVCVLLRQRLDSSAGTTSDATQGRSRLLVKRRLSAKSTDGEEQIRSVESRITYLPLEAAETLDVAQASWVCCAHAIDAGVCAGRADGESCHT